MSLSRGIPLVSDTLKLSPFQQKSRTPTVSAFVSEQKRYQKHYTKEGISAFEAWMKLSSGQAKDFNPSQSRPYASTNFMCMSSPLLQPRVPEASVNPEAPSVQPNFKPTLQTGNDSNILRPISAHKISEELVIDEHAIRLQRRRERRDAKKAILNPKVSGSVGDSGQVSQRETHAQKERRSSKKLMHPAHRDDAKTIKKKRSSRSGSCRRSSVTSTPQKSPPQKRRVQQISAGLSLMQNFDAKNIARSRITLKQPPKIGVFNKGVASAPTKVGRRKHDRARRKDANNIFSEYAFLNRTRPLKHAKSPETTGSCLDSSTSSGSDNAEEDHRLSTNAPKRMRTIKFDQKKISKFFPSLKPNPTNTRDTTPEPQVLQSVEGGNYDFDDGASLDQSKGHTRPESPPWNIDWAAEGLDPPGSEHFSVEWCDHPVKIDSHEKRPHAVLGDRNSPQPLAYSPGLYDNSADIEYSLRPGATDMQSTLTARDSEECVPTENQSFTASHAAQEPKDEILCEELLAPSRLAAQGLDIAYHRDEPSPFLMPPTGKTSSRTDPFGSGSLAQLNHRIAPGHSNDALSTRTQDYHDYEGNLRQDRNYPCLDDDYDIWRTYNSFSHCSPSGRGHLVGRAHSQNISSGILGYSQDGTDHYLDSTLPYTSDEGLTGPPLGLSYTDGEQSFGEGYYKQVAATSYGHESVALSSMQAYDSTSLYEGRASFGHCVEPQTPAPIPFQQLQEAFPPQVCWPSPPSCHESPENINDFSCASTSSAKEHTESFQEGRALLLGFDSTSKDSSSWMEEEDEERRLVKTLLGNGSASWWGKRRT